MMLVVVLCYGDALRALGLAYLVKLNLKLFCHGQRLLVLILQDLLLLLDHLEAGKLGLAHFDRAHLRAAREALPVLLIVAGIVRGCVAAICSVLAQAGVGAKIRGNVVAR